MRIIKGVGQERTYAQRMTVPGIFIRSFSTQMARSWMRPAYLGQIRAPEAERKNFVPSHLRQKQQHGLQKNVPMTPAVSANDETRNVNQLMTHFSKILTKHGARGEDIMASVNATLRHRYHHPSPISIAVDAIKPVLKYQKFKNARAYVPVVLHPKPSCGIAMRWIVELAGKRVYVGQRPCLERGLVDEIDAIIQGSSSLYARRMQFHKNPN